MMLDPYLPGNSAVHRLDGRVKLILALGFILTAALLPTGAWAAFLLLAAAVFSAALLAEVSIGRLIRRTWLAVPFLLAALPQLCSTPGPALAGFSLGSLRIEITLPGTVRFLTVAARAWLSLAAAVTLTATTPFSDILVAMRALKLPRFLAGVIGLMWRYLFVMADSAARLVRARESRSGMIDRPDLHPGGSLLWRASVTGNMVGSLLLRSFDRAERVYTAMLARGYDGEPRSLPLAPLSTPAWLLLVGGGAFCLLILVIGRLVMR